MKIWEYYSVRFVFQRVIFANRNSYIVKKSLHPAPFLHKNRKFTLV